jgi:hypothetical protein
MLFQSQSRPSVYHHFILLVWEERGMDGPYVTWRFSLQDSQNTERMGFKNLEELKNFLEKWLKTPQPVEKSGQNG